jgi:hypothetical protein
MRKQAKEPNQRREIKTLAGSSTHNKPTKHNREEISLPSTPVNYPIHDALYATSYAVQS